MNVFRYFIFFQIIFPYTFKRNISQFMHEHPSTTETRIKTGEIESEKRMRMGGEEERKTNCGEEGKELQENEIKNVYGLRGRKGGQCRMGARRKNIVHYSLRRGGWGGTGERERGRVAEGKGRGTNTNEKGRGRGRECEEEDREKLRERRQGDGTREHRRKGIWGG